MALGRVRAAQQRLTEAEALLRLALAEFLSRQGLNVEAEDWIAKTRSIVALFGSNTPLQVYVEGRIAALASPVR